MFTFYSFTYDDVDKNFTCIRVWVSDNFSGEGRSFFQQSYCAYNLIKLFVSRVNLFSSNLNILLIGVSCIQLLQSLLSRAFH